MITSARITELAEHPDLMDESTLAELGKAVAEWPFFHVARILLLENMLSVDHPGRESELCNQKIYLPCFKEIGTIVNDAMSCREAALMSKDRTMSLLNDFLGDADAAAPLIFDTPASSDYLSLMGETGGNDVNNADAERSDADSLIDSFLSAGAEAFKATVNDCAVDGSDDKCESSGEYCAGEAMNSALNAELFTETLASIYIKQHRYSEAIEIISSLSLNFPNKSSYFADQIRYLEKLIELSKQKRD